MYKVLTKIKPPNLKTPITKWGEEMHRHVSEEPADGQQAQEKRSLSLIIRKKSKQYDKEILSFTSEGDTDQNYW